MSRIYHLGMALIFATVAIVLFAGPASAHTGFESSDPNDGATIGEPVTTITLAFTGATEPAGDGFQVLDPSGVVRASEFATSDDGRTWVLQLDPPISGGEVGVRWMVKAPDAHMIDGSFSFAVSAPAVASAEGEQAVVPDRSDAGSADATAVAQDGPVDLSSFLDTASEPTVARRFGAAGRALTMLGSLTGVGALAFAAAVLRGDRRDIFHVLYWVRRAGLLIVAGTVVQVVAKVVVEGGGQWSSALQLSTIGSVVISQFGLAATLRIVGGCALSSGARFDTAQASGAPDAVVTIKELVGVGAGPPVDVWGRNGSGFNAGMSPGGSEPYVHEGDHAWLVTTESATAYVGAASVLAAYLFDGHTVSKGNRWFTAVVDLVHVAGAAVWAGGLLMLVAVVWSRHRQGRELRAFQLAIRFSVVASAALVAVGVAGLVLTVIVLDSPSELWSTDWGRILVAKTVFVALAGVAGGYNHKVLIPQLSFADDDPELSGQFRTVISLEAAALVIAIGLTALLVGAAS